MTHSHRRTGLLLVLGAVMAMMLLTGGITYRAYQASQHQRTLCDTLVRIIRVNDASLDQFAYFKHHPAELERQHEQARATIRRLDCGAL